MGLARGGPQQIQSAARHLWYLQSRAIGGEKIEVGVGKKYIGRPPLDPMPGPVHTFNGVGVGGGQIDP